jgi:hypothetical protein
MTRGIGSIFEDAREGRETRYVVDVLGETQRYRIRMPPIGRIWRPIKSRELATAVLESIRAEITSGKSIDQAASFFLRRPTAATRVPAKLRRFLERERQRMEDCEIDHVPKFPRVRWGQKPPQILTRGIRDMSLLLDEAHMPVHSGMIFRSLPHMRRSSGPRDATELLRSYDPEIALLDSVIGRVLDRPRAAVRGRRKLILHLRSGEPCGTVRK